MTIKPKQMLVSKSKYDIKCPYAMDAEYITFHNTANDASAQDEVSYMIGNNAQISFHYAVDDEEVVQGLPINRNAWHTGDGGIGEGNRKSIGVEVCYSKSGGDKYRKAEALAIKFIAQLLYERNWGIDRVRTHKSWTEIGVKKGYSSYVKNCPHRVLDEGRWQQVLNAIEAELNNLKGDSKPVVKQAEPKKESAPKPVAKKKYVVLPASATSWNVYPTNKQPIKVNSCGQLNPKKYNSLTYEILGNPQADVYTIQTKSFGKVNVYAASNTGAKIILK